MPVPSHAAPRGWAEAHVLGAERSDVRRTPRVVTIAEARAARPGCRMPQLCAPPDDRKAADHLLPPPASPPDHRQAGHQARGLAQRPRPGVSRLVEETTPMSGAGNNPLAGVGPMRHGAEGLPGFL